MVKKTHITTILIFITIAFFMSSIILNVFQEDTNYNDGDSSLVEVHIDDFKIVSTTTINGKVTYTYKLHGSYKIDSKYYYDTFNYTVKSNIVPETITLYVNNTTKEVTMKSNIPFNPIILIPISIVLITVTLLVIFITNNKEKMQYKKVNGNYITNNTQYKKSNDDPFDKEDCKYNIDKDDPFADFYRKGNNNE